MDFNLGRGRYCPKAEYQWSTARWSWIRTRTRLFADPDSCRVFYRQGMWLRTIHWRVQDHKFSANSSGSHSIQQSWYRGDHDPNHQQINMYGWNHVSQPGEPQPILCIWYDSLRQPYFRSPNFCSNRGSWLYAPVVFQRDYTWSKHKNPHIQRDTDVPTCYVSVGTWVGYTECLLPQDIAYCGGGDSK